MVPVRCSVASRASRIVLTLLLVPGILGLTAGRAVAVACSVRNLNTWVFYTDLQVAISAAAPGAALRVSGTCVGNFSVAQDLNLFGRSGATLDGNGTGTTLKVSAGDVKVFGLTITGGTGWDACAPAGCFIAGGIYNLGTLTLVRSAVSGNSVTNVGGGIFNDVGGTLTIAGSTVSENSAPFGGGGINNLGTLVLWRSVVDGNSAQGGGGILNNGTLTISRSSVRDNVATDYFGGGIINNGMITINRSTLSGNSSPSAGGYGGAITNQEGTITITDSKVTGNSASALGGGIQNQTGGTIHLNHSTLTATSASFGGGIFEGGGTLQIDSLQGQWELSRQRWRRVQDRRWHHHCCPLRLGRELGHQQRRRHLPSRWRRNPHHHGVACASELSCHGRRHLQQWGRCRVRWFFGD